MLSRLTTNQYTDGILSGDRLVLSRGITLIESQLESDRAVANEVLEKLLPYSGRSLRVGITGVPGVGKSTFIEALGNYVTSQSKKLAVLAIDPTSQRTGGSIMGDKTRMNTLAYNPMAYIRPSPAGASLGGVAHKTRETLIMCEAAGFEVIFIETVGVGQSETLVKNMTDFFLLLILAGAGDELQGIKKGIVEMADAIAITKSDGENVLSAQRAVIEYQNALHLLSMNSNGWTPQTLTCSALENRGIEKIWQMIEDFETFTKSNGFFEQNRKNQQLDWLKTIIAESLENKFYKSEIIKKELTKIEQQLLNEQMLATTAAQHLLKIFLEN